ncbi:MAG: LON peptidase substrate-binding domain-containing protein [Beijerinckiaceae bacterium]
MSINNPYRGPDELPAVIPVFPLTGVLLLPRGQLPLNVFEPRYMAMVEDVLKAHRIIGMVQPDAEASDAEVPRLLSVGCAGRVTQFAETGDGRFLLTLTGIARYRIVDEISAVTAYRQCRVDFSPFEGDFLPHSGEEAVDRDGVLTALGNFAEANQLQIDWKSVRETPNEALVNALSMMSPYGPREKQALLEAPDLRTRADVLIAITEITLARSNAPRPLQ